MKKPMLLIALFNCFFLATLNAQDANIEFVEATIVSWNIQMLPNEYSIFSESLQKKQRFREPEIAKFCNGEDFDIIIFQEVFDGGIRRKLRRELKNIYPYQVNTKTKLGRLTNNGVFIVSRLPIKLIDFTIYPKGVNEDSWAAKGCTLIEAIKDGIKFHIAGTHLQSGESEKATKHKHIQYKEINKLITKNNNDKIPVFVIGDMNTEKSDTVNYKKMLEIIGVEDFAINDEEPYTIDRKNSWNSHEHGIQLDYILTNKRSTKTTILKQNIIRPHFKLKNKKIDLSDHYGIVAHVRISNN